jgi:hypothetical protein
MQGSLFDRVLLGGFLIVCGLLLIIFHKKMNAHRVSTTDWLPRYIHWGEIGSVIFIVGIVLFGAILILLGIGEIFGVWTV